MFEFSIQTIPHGSKLYESSKVFRDKILRKPLGLTLGLDEVAGEDEQTHIVALDNANAIVATVVLKPLSSDTIKLRQMAVDSELQRQGLGRKMVAFAEEWIRTSNYKNIELAARLPAQNFYKKLGYTVESGEFCEGDIPIVKMAKVIS